MTSLEKLNFDTIIVGAGSAGCLLANRLSADPNHKVLLIEAGGQDDWIWIKIPVGYLFTINNPRTDWCFKTEPDPGLNGRSIHYARGKVIGGSSSINAMIYMRGQESDYQQWSKLTGDLFGIGTIPYLLLNRLRAILQARMNGMAVKEKCEWKSLECNGLF